jgi:Undecaprenyl-phosphate galactose phosphotransferase WbaP
MSIAASADSRFRRNFAAGRKLLWLRAAAIIGLMAADLGSFVIADLIIRTVGAPPAIALFRAHLTGQSLRLDIIGVIATAFVIARYLAGDYSRRQLFWDGARHTTNSLLVCGLPYLAILLLLGLNGLAITALVWFGLLFVVPMMRQGMRFLLGQAGLWYLPSAILGGNATAQEVYLVLNDRLSLGLSICWLAMENCEGPLPPSLKALKPVHAQPEDLVASLVAVGCRQVIWVPDDRLPLAQNDLIDQFIGADIRVAIVPSLRRLPLFGLSTSSFFGKDLLLLQVRNNLARLPQRILKRVVDIAGSLFALVLLSPLFVALSILIKREDGGPIFFIQKRIGRDGLDFSCWKFRSMTLDAEAQLSRWAKDEPLLLERYRQSNFKLPTDPRITRIGAWMRRKSLDELPQLINVLLGEMSLVGPRPLLRRELPDYGVVITLYKRVRPGITGMWQISGRSHTTFAERVSYDEWYIKNWTLWYDIVILLQTVWVLQRGEGAY